MKSETSLQLQTPSLANEVHQREVGRSIANIVRERLIHIKNATKSDHSILQRSFNHACRDVCYLKTSDRLMPLAKQAILDAESKGTSLPSGCLWVAEELGSAKGRMTRHWWAPKGGLYMCLAIHPCLLKAQWAHYSLAIGTGIAKAFRQLDIKASVKWINDVFINGKKVAGVLSETVQTPNEIYILFGIGININQELFPSTLPFATSLFLETGKKWDILRVAGAILSEICWLFGEVEEWEAENLVEDPLIASQANPVLRQWCELTDTLGKRCLYGHDVFSSPEIKGIAKGITPEGSLILETEEQELITVSTGEIWYY